MILVLAAMMEELRVALDLCSQRSRLPLRGVRVWRGMAGGQSHHFLKTGVGPARAAKSLEQALGSLTPDFLLVAGYAGALDGRFRIGDLIAATHAQLLGGDADQNEASDDATPLSDIEILPDLMNNSDLTLQRGGILTSDRLIGDPLVKRRLHEKYGASMVDMETAALARIAHSRGIPLACIRAISDVATDDLLAPFSKGIGEGEASRIAKWLTSGRWRDRYKGWKAGAEAARASLRRFFIAYFESLGER